MPNKVLDYKSLFTLLVIVFIVVWPDVAGYWLGILLGVALLTLVFPGLFYLFCLPVAIYQEIVEALRQSKHNRNH